MFEVAAACSSRRVWRALQALQTWAATSSAQNSSSRRMAYQTAGRLFAVRLVMGVEAGCWWVIRGATGVAGWLES